LEFVILSFQEKKTQALLDFGDRVQYSVFEAKLDKTLFDNLIQRANGIIEESEDSVRIYPMCNSCENGVSILGLGKVFEDKDVYIL
jgi:CRISPR-associated protein Cas2